MNKLTTFYLVRHGETEYNLKGIAQGHLDSPLTPKGIEDARKLGVKFKDIFFDMIFSSDLLRAKRTAEIISLERNLAVQTTKLLRERHYGKYEGKPYKAVYAYRKLLNKLKTQKNHNKVKDQFEEDESLISRLITFLRETSVAFPGCTILVVTHGGIMRIFLKHMGFTNMPSGSIENLGYYIVETDGVDFFLKNSQGINFKNI